MEAHRPDPVRFRLAHDRPRGATAPDRLGPIDAGARDVVIHSNPPGRVGVLVARFRPSELQARPIFQSLFERARVNPGRRADAAWRILEGDGPFCLESLPYTRLKWGRALNKQWSATELTRPSGKPFEPPNGGFPGSPLALVSGRCKQMLPGRVVQEMGSTSLHLEQPAKHSRLFPRAINPANVKQQLKQLIKPIDPHPLVTETRRMNGVAWSVR